MMRHGGDIYKRNIANDFSVNINPLGIPSEVVEAIRASLDHLSEYPDIHQRRLRAAVCAAEGCKTENVLGGNGSSELFLSVVQTVRPAAALLVSPCFSGYEYALNTVRGCKIRYLAETEISSLADRIDPDTGMVMIANPNNPSGKNIDKSLLESIAEKCENTGTCLVVDECFLPLSEHQYSLSSLAVQSRNLFVVKSFTKTFAIPGIRIGYVISSADNIALLEKSLPEWNLSIPASEAGVACAGLMKDGAFIKQSYDYVKTEREYLETGLSGLGFEVVPSDTCFILFRGETGLFEKLLEKGILIRDCSDFRELGKGWYRISVKDRRADQDLINLIKGIVNP